VLRALLALFLLAPVPAAATSFTLDVESAQGSGAVYLYLDGLDVTGRRCLDTCFVDESDPVVPAVERFRIVFDPTSRAELRIGELAETIGGFWLSFPEYDETYETMPFGRPIPVSLAGGASTTFPFTLETYPYWQSLTVHVPTLENLTEAWIAEEMRRAMAGATLHVHGLSLAVTSVELGAPVPPFVPEPGTALLLSLGLFGLCSFKPKLIPRREPR